jgi:hypothetical protein
MSEATALRLAVGIASLVPISAGFVGAAWGAAAFGLGGDGFADGHLRYLSGLLLGIGLAFAASIPRIPHASARVTLLASIVGLGGLARLVGAIAAGSASRATLFALAMELLVTPAIALWQRRVARQAERGGLTRI